MKASALAGTTPLRLASLFDFTMDLTLYSEGFMAIDNSVKRLEYISVDRLINQPVTDPGYVSIKDYVNTTLSGGSFASDKVTPPVLVGMLERDCNAALDLVKNINTANNTALMFEVADIKTWANLGLHFAEKLKGAVALQTYLLRGGDKNKQEAILHLKKALSYWDVVVGITRPIYNNMPLVHLSEQNGERTKENRYLEFHWEKLRPDVARDVEIAKNTIVKAAK